MVVLRSHSFQASILLIFLLFPASSFARFTTKSSSNLLQEICSKTQNPSFCLNLLRSDRRAGSADIQGIATITIGKAKAEATKTLALIKSLILNANSPKLKQGYTACSNHYNIAIGYIDQAEQNLRRSNADGVYSSASETMDAALNCHDELEVVSPDPRLMKGNEDLESICNIILVIANFLPIGGP